MNYIILLLIIKLFINFFNIIIININNKKNIYFNNFL